MVSEYSKPLPAVTTANRPFWEGAKSGRLVMLRCRECGHWVYPFVGICQRCWGEQLDWEEASGFGTVSSWCVYHKAFLDVFAEDVPYAVVEVALDEGPRLISNVVDVGPAELRPGMRVRAVFDHVTHDISLVKFRPAELTEDGRDGVANGVNHRTEEASDGG